MATPKTDKRRTRMPTHVMVVEDDAVLALAIECALSDAGVEDIALCDTTDEALAVLRRARPDAIILDVHLADRNDGWAIAELVGALGPKPPQIIFSTGQPEAIPQDIAAMGRILAKPYDIAELVELLCQPAPGGLVARLRGI